VKSQFGGNYMASSQVQDTNLNKFRSSSALDKTDSSCEHSQADRYKFNSQQKGTTFKSMATINDK